MKGDFVEYAFGRLNQLNRPSTGVRMEKSTGKLPWPVAVALVAILVGGAIWAANRITSRNPGALASATRTSALAGQEVQVLGNGMLYYDGTTLHALNDNAQQIWSYAAGTGAGFSVDSGGVCSWSGTMVTFLTSEDGKILYSGNMNETILDACIGLKYAAVQVGEEHNSVIYLMESGGRRVDEIDLKDLTVLDFGFFSNDSLFWVMTLDTEGTIPVCAISTYRPGKMLAGTIQDTQQVLYEVVFQSSKIRAVGTTHIKDFDYTGKEISDNRMLVYGWYLTAMNDDTVNPLMAFVPMDQSDGTASITDVRLIQSQQDFTVHLPYKANRVVVGGDNAYAFNSQYVSVCRPGDTLPTTYALPVYIDSVLGITDSRVVIASSGGSVYMIRLA